ncbi:MAG: hypothetical protein K8U57_02050 [Planctomycetes bacterium]|nr:hypothetical protein [Planctomycetota bacterium]
MDSMIIRLKDCPFCCHEQVVVFADKQHDYFSNPDCPSDGPIVQFCSHIVTHEPCTHLVHLEVECWQRDGDMRAQKSEGEYDGYIYPHPALMAADPDHELVEILRQILPESPDEVDRRITSFRFVRSDAEGLVNYSHDPDQHGDWSAIARGLYAEDVARFIRQSVVLRNSLCSQ